MKDKKAEQNAAKEKHREQLKANRRAESSLDRPTPVLIEKPTILIVCEGENTEPSYFKQFRLSSATIKAVGEGYNTTSLVNRALQLANKGKYEQVWCVFDKDDFNNNSFNDAIKIAEANRFGVAYSNQSFEYWIILHFEDHQGGNMPRIDYDIKINKLLKPYNLKYEGNKSKLITEDIFQLLNDIDTDTGKERVKLAIKRAERNYNQFDHTNPAIEESSTTVFKLVSELLKYV
ncbi:RloB family protein [Arcicella aquatica]|uniref:RloB family protein n=1 Tax=Arcicella aquatica TaxID=217141 RepID=A0ABU5QUC1_9BACT|nr:RloB family protein [Arcicella aquatica]MEA5260613.1 RloB family protein [Arcicella aquatica]